MSSNLCSEPHTDDDVDMEELHDIKWSSEFLSFLVSIQTSSKSQEASIYEGIEKYTGDGPDGINTDDRRDDAIRVFDHFLLKHTSTSRQAEFMKSYIEKMIAKIKPYDSYRHATGAVEVLSTTDDIIKEWIETSDPSILKLYEKTYHVQIKGNKKAYKIHMSIFETLIKHIESNLPHCKVCKKDNVPLRLCPLCAKEDRITYYCSRECQVKDWPSHKREHPDRKSSTHKKSSNNNSSNNKSKKNNSKKNNSKKNNSKKNT